MKRFNLIEHTADTGLVAYGNSLAEAFSNAGYGLFSIITNINRVRQVESQLIEVSTEDIESLLFEWLNNLRLIWFWEPLASLVDALNHL